MTEKLGSGIYLDENLDFSIDSTGDLRMNYGGEELQKDLAFQMIISLSKFLGQPPTKNLNSKVSSTAERVALADSRIRSVDRSSIDVSYSEDRKEITIEMRVNALDSEQTLVFEI